MALRNITIIGLGNIGGSLALALKNNGRAELEITGFSRSSEKAKEALQRNIVNKVANNLTDAVVEADMVIVSTPVSAMEGIFQQIGNHLKPGAVVADVGSTKIEVCKWGNRYINPGASFIGGHPMAGSAAVGIGGANGELFLDSVFCIVTDEDTPDYARQALEQLVDWIGARPLQMTALQHDHYVASVSHLPMLLASALVSTAVEHAEWETMSELAAQGFREMTRMAAGSAEVRRSICRTNKQPIIKSIDRLINTLSTYKELIINDDEDLLALFDDAGSARKKWIAKRYPRS
jgi:prephenate dehydrogenase